MFPSEVDWSICWPCTRNIVEKTETWEVLQKLHYL